MSAGHAPEDLRAVFSLRLRELWFAAKHRYAGPLSLEMLARREGCPGKTTIHEWMKGTRKQVPRDWPALEPVIWGILQIGKLVNGEEKLVISVSAIHPDLRDDDQPYLFRWKSWLEAAQGSPRFERSPTPADSPATVLQGRMSGVRTSLNVAEDRGYVLEDFGGSPLSVETNWVVDQPSRLLATACQIVPFGFREQELGQLSAWRDQVDRAPTVQLLYGPGGQGKTRLAMEFARESHDLGGWLVIQAKLGSAAVSRQALSAGRAIRARRVLMVVDYAERWPPELLHRLIHEPLLARTAGKVLLVARSTGTWWEQLLYQEAISEERVVARRPMELLSSASPRQELFRAARNAFASHFGIRDPDVIAMPDNLAHPEFGLMLMLHMAALAAVDAHVR